MVRSFLINIWELLIAGIITANQLRIARSPFKGLVERLSNHISMLGTSARKVEDYDAIGFDMDLCIARYKFKSFLKIMYESCAAKLVRDHGYPSDMFPEDEDIDRLMSFVGRVVVDLSNMLVMKIGEKGEILRVFDGEERLSNDEIKKIYGDDPKLTGIDLENLNFGQNYYFASDLFKCDYIYIFLRIKELIKKKGKYPFLEKLTSKDVLDDLKDASSFNYHHYRERYMPPEEVGFYFPMFKVNPKRFLHKMNTEVFEKLRQLKDSGKVVFLITNSHVGYYDIIFPFVTQDTPDAEKILDYIGMNAGKPKFFKRDDIPFYRVDYSKRDLRSPHEMNFAANKFFLEGNVANFTKELQNKLGKQDIKVLYFGDNSTGDMECVRHPCWENAFIYEEMCEASDSLRSREDYYDFTNMWGSWLTDTTINGDTVNTLLYGKAKNQFCKAFSRVCSKECLDFLTLESNKTKEQKAPEQPTSGQQ
jgi:HAD superfamily 5'-nucleotidase-like hydrolase